MIQRILLAFLICASTAYAEKPNAVITGKKQAVEGSDIILSAKNSICDQKYPIHWQIIADEKPEYIVFDNSEIKGVGIGILNPPPGRLIVTATAYGVVKNEKGEDFLTPATAVHIVEIGETVPKPKPRPDPGPDPKPTPLPTNEKLYVTLLWSDETDTTATLEARAYPSLRDTLLTYNAIWTHISASSEKGQSFLNNLKDKKLPVVVIQNTTGLVIKELNNFKNIKEIIDAVKELR